LFQSGTQVVVQVEVVRSVLMLSDVFTERSQYEWMLHKFLELTRTHPTEDELMQQLLTLGVCKAVALLSPVSHNSLCFRQQSLKIFFNNVEKHLKFETNLMMPQLKRALYTNSKKQHAKKPPFLLSKKLNFN